MVFRWDGPRFCCYCFVRRCGLWLVFISLLQKHLVMFRSGSPFLQVRTSEMFIGACLERQTSFVCSAGWLPDKHLLAQGSRGGGCTLCQTGFWFCISISEYVSFLLVLVHDTISHDFSVKTIRKRWVYFLIWSILANNSSQLSYAKLPFTTTVRPKISFKLCFYN